MFSDFGGLLIWKRAVSNLIIIVLCSRLGVCNQWSSVFRCNGELPEMTAKSEAEACVFPSRSGGILESCNQGKQ